MSIDTENLELLKPEEEFYLISLLPLDGRDSYFRRLNAVKRAFLQGKTDGEVAQAIRERRIEVATKRVDKASEEIVALAKQDRDRFRDAVVELRNDNEKLKLDLIKARHGRSISTVLLFDLSQEIEEYFKNSGILDEDIGNRLENKLDECLQFLETPTSKFIIERALTREIMVLAEDQEALGTVLENESQLSQDVC